MRNNKGFSLVELIVVIAIMAILAAVAIPTFAHFITKANEASDAELLNNINYIFSAACLENGVDVKDVTAATWSMDTMLVTSVKVNGVENAKIVASFEDHFDITDAEFKLIESIYFDKNAHEFVEGVDIYGSMEFDQELIDAIKNSNFGELGADVLLGRIDLATGLLGALAGEGDTRVENMLLSDANMESLAKSLGYNSKDDAGFENELNQLVARKAAMLKEQYPDKTEDELQELATIEILSNNAVLLAATKPQYDQNTFVQQIANGTAKAEIKNNLNTDVSTAMSQAAFVYGMYTSYAVAYDIEIAEDFEVMDVLDAMDDPSFKNYMEKEAQADLNAYNSSMEMINTSTNNKDAVIDVLLNGFNNQGLNNALGDAFN